ncbi:AAA family ATPase [Pseudodesulfovibrio sp. JC047]|uniref:UvrD-helicase domain-containing protein n=1 Tax=Pseudodesulfovibrio sp. JC047 TaxID=2683199 RepID=UPI0013D2484D|nr:UvrD-helicase domain-containing protein [Pseudodesulfovibrio sp. JC047]NDV18781.1 AAA family ATPase [Pseudodesulfovibrio sp. JC047]
MSLLKQIKASAGSGKTYQLTRRFLTLLDASSDSAQPFICTGKKAHGFTWPEIMAVTFTNKAAAEMKERVVKGLKSSALNQGEERHTCSPDAARTTLSAILRRYHSLNIRTIDSLLALLLRLFALEFGIRPDFEIVFDEQELFDAVYDHFMDICLTDEAEHERLSKAMDTLIRTEGRNGFWIQDAIRSRIKELADHLRDIPGPLLTDQPTIKELLTTEYAAFKQAIADMTVYLNDTGLPANKNFLKFLAKCDALTLFDAPPDSKLIHKDSFADCVLKKGKPMVTEQVEAQYAHLQRVWAKYQSNHAMLCGAYTLAPAIDIAEQLTTGLDAVQKQRGMILGSSLAGHVNQLLTGENGVSEAYCRLGSRLHHLLVDEFQDTSRDQWKAITPLTQECLAKGGSLYFVGDVKQAIYGWRGGDSSLFDEVMTQPDIAPIADEKTAETLPDNWRSFRNVVEFNNLFFHHLETMDQTSQLADTLFSTADEPFKAEFAFDLTRSFAECGQSLPPKTADTSGYVRMKQLPGSKNSEIEENALTALNSLMDDLTARRNYKDIGILVRSHGHAALVCDLLVRKNIPVITENSLQLDRHPIVRQLAGLLGFLDYPRDDLAFLTFIGGSELFQAEAELEAETVLDWLIIPQKKPLGVQFREDYPDLWRRFIEPFYNQSGLMTPYDLTREAIRVFRVLERHPESELYVRRFLEVVHLAEENGYGSLTAFLEYWTEKSGDEKVPLPENIDAVRIMTIHKSKGLEFPVVIVPFHHWSVKPDQDFSVQEFEGNRVLVPMNKGLGRPYHESLGRAVREQLNLLYVAWTRSREELYGFFAEKPTTSPALAAMNQFLDLDENGCFEYGVTPTETCPSEPQTPVLPRELPRDETESRLMEWLPRLRVYRHNLDDYFFNERMRGEIAHKTMEYMTITGDDAADTERSMRLAIQDFPEVGALPANEYTQLTDELRAMSLWALSDIRLRTWLEHGLREPEIMDDKGQFKRIDLLSLGKETAIVDFKTGQPTPKNHEQVSEYMTILSSMPDIPEPQGFLVYLDLKKIIEVGRDA